MLFSTRASRRVRNDRTVPSSSGWYSRRSEVPVSSHLAMRRLLALRESKNQDIKCEKGMKTMDTFAS